ncbi:hypothetical protein SUGI_0132480 [Cryptomeria japonica]|nr:hypothetical protein SUGI_0132480 [Cryptomeria japonica]
MPQSPIGKQNGSSKQHGSYPSMNYILPSQNYRFKSLATQMSGEDFFYFGPNYYLVQGLTATLAKDLADYEIGEALPEDYGEFYPHKDPLECKRAGILLHPTSFPGPYRIGELSQELFNFLNWLETTGYKVW